MALHKHNAAADSWLLCK